MVAARKPRARRIVADAEVTLAQRNQTLEQLRAVLGLVDRRAYMPPEQQAVVAIADAFVAESERW